jgi:antitoxin MazE
MEGKTMVKTLTKHGNSRALVIDKPILDLLHISDDTLLDISTDGKNLIISPVSEDERAARLKKSLDRGNQKFGNALKNLANG